MEARGGDTVEDARTGLRLRAGHAHPGIEAMVERG
jgi:hypothetical protein